MKKEEEDEKRRKNKRWNENALCCSSILQFCGARDPFRADSHVFIKALCHLFERNKRENIADMCGIPFPIADAEATRLRRRVAVCTYTEM